MGAGEHREEVNMLQYYARISWTDELLIGDEMLVPIDILKLYVVCWFNNFVSFDIRTSKYPVVDMMVPVNHQA